MDYYDSFLESQATARCVSLTEASTLAYNSIISRGNRCTVQLCPAKNSWVALPSPVAMQLLQSNTPMPAIFELIPQGAPGAPPPAPPAHVAWVGDICTAPGAIIQVPTALAACLQLLPGMPVTLKVCNYCVFRKSKTIFCCV